MDEIIDHAARKLIVAAIAYYRFDHPIMPDYEYDRIAAIIASNWDYLSPLFKETLGGPDDIRATGYHFLASQAAYHATLHELRQRGVDREIDPNGFQAQAEWVSEDGKETVQLMGITSP